MNLRCDLHSHSTVSDGTLTPTELILRAFDKGVEVFALTDHDATEGLKEEPDCLLDTLVRIENYMIGTVVTKPHGEWNPKLSASSFVQHATAQTGP